MDSQTDRMFLHFVTYPHRDKLRQVFATINRSKTKGRKTTIESPAKKIRLTKTVIEKTRLECKKGQTMGQTDDLIIGKTDRWPGNRSDRQPDNLSEGDNWMDGWTDRQKGGQLARQMVSQPDRY